MPAPQAPIVYHTVTIKTGQDISSSFSTNTTTRNELVNKLVNLLTGVTCSATPGDLFVDIGAVPSKGWWTITTGAGVVGISLQGTAVTVTSQAIVAGQFPTQLLADQQTAVLLATAINANATINKYVFASADSTFATGGRVVLTARTSGTVYNILTLTTSGAGTVQAVSGATLGAGAAPASTGTSSSLYINYQDYALQGR